MTDPIEIMARAMAPLVSEDMEEPFRSGWLSNLATAAISALTDAGFAVVPVEPTETMLSAGQEAWLNDPARRSSTLYRAMIQAGRVKA